MKSASDIVIEYDSQEGPLSEIDVYSRLESIAKDKDNISNFDEKTFRSELIAFAFDENYSWDRWRDEGWKTYFGPLAVMSTQEYGSDSAMIFPHISEVTSETIDYWSDRANKSTHPVIKVRYLSLIWDFYKYAKNANPPVKVPQELIDTVIIMAQQRKHKYEIDELNKLKHALKISLSINDQKRVNAVKDEILAYDRNVVKGDMAAEAWSVPFDHLLVNKKISLSEEEINEILSRLEVRFDRLSVCKGGGIQSLLPIKHAVDRLAKYYNRKSMKEELKAALRKYFDAVYKKVELGSPIQQCAWLDEAMKFAKKYNMADEVNQITLKLQEASSNLHKDMQPISVSLPVDINKIDQCINSMVDGDIHECLRRLAFCQVTPVKYIEDMVKNLARECVFVYNISIPITDHDGRRVAVIGPVREDLRGHTYWQAGKNLMLNIGFGAHRRVTSEIFKKHSVDAEVLLKHICLSPLFLENKKEILKEGLHAYLKEMPTSAVHILVPQVEAALRTLLELQGQPTYKQNKNGGYNLRLLDDILRDGAVVGVLGEDVCFHFRTLFTDQRGLCLRHNCCHGLSGSNSYTMGIADLVFQALLMLSDIREKSEDSVA